MKNHFIFLLGTLLLSMPSMGAYKKAKNVILFIGDGMGPTVITATRIHFKGKTGLLNMDTLPYTARVKTYSLNHVITDSAAAASAMSTGIKVRSGVVGRDQKAVPPYSGQGVMGESAEHIIESAIKAGLSGGIVTNNHVFHGTPSGFFAHSNYRNDFKAIGKDLAKTPTHLIFGGGQKLAKNHLNEIKRNFKVVQRLTKNVAKDCYKKKHLGLFAEGHIPYAVDRTSKSQINLSQMTSWALNCLSQNPKGFFLMVEGGRIDHALHQRKIYYALHETKEFDDVIGETISFLTKRNLLKDTLVLVTADHDTGGLAVNSPMEDQAQMFVKDSNNQFSPTQIKHYSGKGPGFSMIKLSTDEIPGIGDSTHTAVDVPLYAIGLNAEKVRGTIENTDIYQFMMKSLRLKSKTTK